MKFYKKTLILDDLINLNLIDARDYLKLKSLTSDRKYKIYFFRNLRNPKWFKSLFETNELVDSLNADSDNNDNRVLQIAISDYLKIVVSENPAMVVNLIKQVHTNNDFVIWAFAEIGLTVPAKYTARLVAQVKIWSKNHYLSSTNYAPVIAQWIDHLVRGGELKSALRLLKILTTPRIQKPMREQDKELEKIIGRDRSKAIPLLDYYYLKGMLSKGITKLIEFEPLKVSEILANSLERAIKIEFSYVRDGSDMSYIWRPAIEEHSQNYEHFELKDALLVTLRDTVEMIVAKDIENGRLIIVEYLNHKYSLFRRLAIHLLRLNFKAYSDMAIELSRDNKLLRSPEIYHEYYLFLKDNFDQLSPETQDSIIQSIVSYDNSDPDAKPELQEKQRNYYWIDHLRYFKVHLKGETKKLFDELTAEFKEEKFRDTVSWHESYVGEKAPISENELEGKNNKEFWNYLRTFTPTRRGIDSPTQEGLARVFNQVVKKNPERFLKEDLNQLIDLPPTFSYWLFHLIGEELKKDMDSIYFKYVKNILFICSRIMKLENLPKRFTEDIDINFVGVKRRILDVIEALIKTHQKKFPIDHKNLIWEIIEYLCYYESDPDDTPDSEKERFDPFTLSLNSVRGKAMHALIDYALWYAYHTKDTLGDEKRPNRFKGEERIQHLLEEKLDKNKDSSLAIHSVFGVFLANLAYLNYNWLNENIERIFPREKDKRIYWETALSGYLNASRFYSDLYKLLKPQFLRALKYLSKESEMIPAGFGRSPEEALSEHLIVACLNNLDDIKEKESLLKKFISIPENSSITYAVQFVSNLAKDQKIFEDDPAFNQKSFWPQAKEFWKVRINVVKSELRKKQRVKEEDEFDREFSRYISWLDELPTKVTLKELESLLTDTIKINQRGWHLPNFVEYLSKQSDSYPIISIRLISELMNTKAPKYFFNGKETEIVKILQNAIHTNKKEAYSLAEKIANTFGEWGNYYFKDFWINNFLPSITILNITEKDVVNQRMRILKQNKKYFPKEKVGRPRTYELKIQYGDEAFFVKYRVGSKDRRVRSGILIFGKEDYKEKINIIPGRQFKINVLIKNKYYKLSTVNT